MCQEFRPICPGRVSKPERGIKLHRDWWRTYLASGAATSPPSTTPSPKFGLFLIVILAVDIILCFNEAPASMQILEKADPHGSWKVSNCKEDAKGAEGTYSGGSASLSLELMLGYPEYAEASEGVGALDVLEEGAPSNSHWSSIGRGKRNALSVSGYSLVSTRSRWSLCSSMAPQSRGSIGVQNPWHSLNLLVLKMIWVSVSMSGHRARTIPFAIYQSRCDQSSKTS